MLEPLALFKLKLIIWMIKKYIIYNQVKDKNFWKFVVGCSLKIVRAKILFLRSKNTI